MSSAPSKKSKLIDELISEFRISGNQDSAFDNLAARRLGVNETDLHCLNIIENSGRLTAGELATQAGLTTGAVTGVIDRLERAGFARRVSDPEDRRRVKLEVTPKFYSRADKIWGPMAADWSATLGSRFTADELERLIEFLRATNEIGRKHLERIGRIGEGESSRARPS
jgi:DNA-binding MarR family transcriptional regulator